MMNKTNSIDSIIKQAQNAFSQITKDQKIVSDAIKHLTLWLTDREFESYIAQIKYLINQKNWAYILDSFYQIIPFGTAGRRGEVGIGPNRINPWTIKASAQGHAQYLTKQYKNSAKTRGIVFAYDVRKFPGNKYLNPSIEYPLKDLTSKKLAYMAAEVYAASGIKVYLFEAVRATPELSFTIRYFQAVAGAMFSASHNPPDHNGQKVYDEFGGQLIPPHDENLVTEVTQNVHEIKRIPFDLACKKGLIQKIPKEIDQKYIKAATSVSLSNERNLSIVYTPLHGCGLTSVYKAMKKMGFKILVDPKTSNESGDFENITFNIPNPEVMQSFDTTLEFAKSQNADILLSSDPDADRIGIIVNHKNEWIFLSGNEIGIIISAYLIQKKKQGLIIKTTVTSSLITKICQKNNVEIIGNLLVGFKYIANVMNNLEKNNKIDQFLFACEESHGSLAGNYSRDKDAVTPAILLSELAAELKKEKKTLVDYLNQIYVNYGYFKNYVAEVRLMSISGKSKINLIQEILRKNPPQSFGLFKVVKHEDCRTHEPIVSETDWIAKDILIFHLELLKDASDIKITIRPSGTEPTIKIYFEIGSLPVSVNDLAEAKDKIEKNLRDLEKAVMLTCYQIIGVDFPERGFLLFWKLPLEDKLKYFEIEPKIEQLVNIKDKSIRQKKLFEMIAFLGSNPIEKIDAAFIAKNNQPILDYLELIN